MTSVSIAICAHRARITHAASLSAYLKAPVAWDEGHLGSIANHDATFELALARAAGAQWCLLIEDDAIAVAPERILDCLRNCPTDAASLYLGTNYPSWAQKRVDAGMHADWITASTFLHGVAMAVRTPSVRPMLDAARHITLDADQRYGAALFAIGTEVSHATTSIFDHRDERTLIDHADGRCRALPRKARRLANPTTCWSAANVVAL